MKMQLYLLAWIFLRSLVFCVAMSRGVTQRLLLLDHGVLMHVFLFQSQNLEVHCEKLKPSLTIVYDTGYSTFSTIFYIAISMIISIKDGKSRSKDYNIPGQKEERIFNALGAIAAIVFANNSGMLPEIQATLQRPAIKNMHKALYLQFTFGIAIYYMVTIVGYWAYGSSISDYMLGDLISGPKWAKILANISVFLQTIVSQHIFCVPVHEALDTRFCRLDEQESSTHNLITRFILRALFFTFSTLCAAMFPFLGDFVTLVGSLSLVPLTFLFPALVFLKVKWCRISRWEKSWHIITVVLFGLVTLGSTISAIRLIIVNARTYHVFANT